jgi:deazaflavin-dependent oxidoreductase (nitroreductase family)
VEDQLMAGDLTDFNSKIIEEFRANEGRVGGMFDTSTLLLLHHTGAKSGTQRVNPLVYLPDDGRYVIVASNGGAASNPAWYHNLKAHPDTRVEVGSDTIDVVASETEGDERERLFATIAGASPQFAEYARTAGRVIPVMA